MINVVRSMVWDGEEVLCRSQYCTMMLLKSSVLRSVFNWLCFIVSTHGLGRFPILSTEEHSSNDGVFAVCTCVHKSSSSFPEGSISSLKKGSLIITSFYRKPHYKVTDNQAPAHNMEQHILCMNHKFSKLNT